MSTRQLPPSVMRGDRLSERGRHDAAIRIWRGFLQKNGGTDKALAETVRERIAQAYYQRSRHALRLKPRSRANAEALAGFEEAVRWDGRNARYRYELGLCRYRTGDFAGAAAELARGIELPGATPAMRHLAVLACLRQGDFVAALNLLAASVAAGDVPEWAWTRLRALALAKSGRVQEALQELNCEGSPPEVWWADVSSLSRSVEAPDDWLHDWLAEQHQRLTGMDALAEAGKIAGLLAAVCDRLGRTEEAMKYRMTTGAADAVAVLATSEQEILQALGDGDPARAVQACRRALEIRPGEAAIIELLAVAEVLAGCAAWQAGRREEAVQAWQCSLETRKNAAATHNLAMAAELATKWKEAAEWWRQTADLARVAGDNEHFILAITRCGLALTRSGKEGEAVKALRQAKDLPVDPGFRRIQGFAYLAAGDVKGAHQAFEAGLAQHPDDARLALGRALAVDLGECTPEEKAETWKRVLELQPNGAAVAYWRQHTLDGGRRTWKAGKLKEAMQLFAALLLRDREDDDGWIWCGLLHLQQGNEAAATDCLQEAIRVRPGSAETLVKVGGCYLLAGQRDEAGNYFNRALEVDPSAATELLIAETSFENKWPELAFERLQSGMRLCEARAPEIPLILRLVIRFGDRSTILSILDDALKVTDGNARIHLMVAVFDHIRVGAWSEAQETLERIPAGAGTDDPVLAEAAAQVSQALILLRTVGTADERAFDQAVQRVLDAWVAELSPPEPDLAARCQARARETLEAILQEVPPAEPRSPGVALPAACPGAGEECFGRPVDVEEWLARGLPSLD